MIAKAKTYVFGDFRFIPSESLLLRQGEAVSLPPKALKLLDKLVESAGSVVTKDDLIRDIWDDLAIEEGAVPRTVFLVRTALGDDPRSHAFIQTVPKRGYRFVAGVSTLNGSNGQTIQAESIADVLPVPDVDVQPVSAVEARRFSAVHMAAVLLLIAAASTGAYLVFFRDVPASNRPSLLVMPVTSAGNENGDELLENGIADALIHHLASSREITVRPLSATRSYSDKTTDPIKAGREQKVSKVLSAGYQRAEGKLRIMARLINVETGETEESYKFETSEAGIFAIQDAVAADLGNKIALGLGAAPGPVRVRGTTNEEAYRYYSQGMALFDLRNGQKAIESFERATDLDPNYARAWVGKAVALGAMPSLGDSSSPELYERTIHAADRPSLSIPVQQMPIVRCAGRNLYTLMILPVPDRLAPKRWSWTQIHPSFSKIIRSSSFPRAGTTKPFRRSKPRSTSSRHPSSVIGRMPMPCTSPADMTKPISNMYG